LKDVWTLSVGQHVVAVQRVGLLGQLRTGLATSTGGWGGFELAGAGRAAKVFFNARTREAHVMFRPVGMTWSEYESGLASIADAVKHKLRN
jgi:hypothetical protein